MTVPGPPRQTIESDECPPPDLLERFIGLILTDEESQQVRMHVQLCQSCLSTLDRMSGSGFISTQGVPTLSQGHQSTVDRLVKELCEEWSRDVSEDSRVSRRGGKPIQFAASSLPNSMGSLQHYEIRREIASGGTATVFEALDTRTHERVAIKFIRRADDATLRRVEREVRAVSAIVHDRIISIRSVERSPDGRMFLVMPLAVGRPMSELIYSQEIGSFDRIVHCVLQVATGLAEVHRCGLVHRDIKPSNIIVDEKGDTRLTDFGLASFVDEESSLTETGMVVGTPAYMSPEQAAGHREVNARSDIYSLGATMYECLTETKPFRGQSHDVLRQIRESEPTRPSLINERIPRPLEAICLKAMSKSPSARYATVGLLIDDLRRWQQGKRVTAKLPGVWQQGMKWLRKDPKFSFALAGVACAVIVGITVSGIYWSRSVEQSKLAESRFDASLQTINTLANLASQSLNGDPGLSSIRKQIQMMADKAFEPLVGQRPSDAQGLIRYLKAMDNLGTIKHTVAGPAEALVFRQKMIDENRDVLISLRANDELRRQWARLNRALAVSHIEMRAFPEATKALDEAASVLSDDIKDQLLVASVSHSRGTIHHWVNTDSANAAKEFRKAVDLVEPYCLAFPDDQLAVATRNNSLGWLAECEAKLGNIELAERLYREVWTHYATLADSPVGTYLQRLEKNRASLTLLNLLVNRGDADKALRWSQKIESDINLLQASNPTLMEPAALKIGFGCDTVGAELLQGKLDDAMARANQLLVDGATLNKQFPNTTRVWQAYGHAKQNWFISCSHVADYTTLIPFLDDWIAKIDQEIANELNVGFNKQFRLGLYFNLALMLDWSGEFERSRAEWEKLLSSVPASMKPGFQLISQIEPYRRSLSEDPPLELVLDEDIEKSIVAAIGFYSAGARYPTVHHSIAECHALVFDLLKRRSSTNESLVKKLEEHRSATEKALQAAYTAGFYNYGNRLRQIRLDPLFQDDAFQRVLAE